MPLPLPNLDTRRWTDLVEEGRALIPRYAPGWTDHNAHDPGITLLELLAWVVEQDVYRANRIPEAHRRKFLQLAGVGARQPTPATAVVAFALDAGPPLELPAGFTLATGGEEPLPFRLRSPLTITPAGIAAVQTFDGARFVDQTRTWQERGAFAAWGEDPALDGDDAVAAPALYVGLDEAPEAGSVVRLWLGFAGTRSGAEERARIEAEAQGSAAACVPPGPLIAAGCDDGSDDPEGGDGPSPETGHHSLVTALEYFDGSGWVALDGVDATRSLTLDGPLAFVAPAAWPPSEQGVLKAAFHYLRVRAESGHPDSSPVVQSLAINAVEVEQSAAARMAFVVREGVTPPAGGEPVAGSVLGLALEFDLEGAITALAAGEDDSLPQGLVIEYVAATDEAPGRLVTSLVLAGVATGLPAMEVMLPGAPIRGGSVALWTGSGDQTRAWEPADDLFAAGPESAAFALDWRTGEVVFGDGERGAVPAAGERILCSYSVTAGDEGNARTSPAWRISGADDGLNRALTGVDPDAIAARVEGIETVSSPAGGDVETIANAAGRAAEALWAHERLAELAATAPGTLDQLDQATVLSRAAPQRAVTLADFERLALDVPGTAIARARAWSELDPTYACLRAPGTVTVVIVPRHPRSRPAPSNGLLRRVRRYLDRRRTIGTRLVVTGPGYVTVRVRVVLRAGRRADPERVRLDVDSAIRAFLDPLSGGPARRGWPFGRDVFRTEVLQVVDGVRNVDHVLELELFARDEEGACGNVCIGPTELVASGIHEVSVV